MFSLGSAAHLGQIVDFELEDPPTICEEKQAVMSMSNQQVPNCVIFAGSHTCDTSTPPALRTISAGRKPLDIAFLGQRNHHFFIRDKVFVSELASLGFHNV